MQAMISILDTEFAESVNCAKQMVDGKLSVFGVEGLRVADASILPRVTTGNTMAPSVVIGEQPAALLWREDSIGNLGLTPDLDLALHRLEVPPDTIHSDREHIE